MNNNIGTILTGVIGGAAVETTAIVAQATPTPEDVQTIGQLLIQIIIGAITVWKLLKKPKDKQ